MLAEIGQIWRSCGVEGSHLYTTEPTRTLRTATCRRHAKHTVPPNKLDMVTDMPAFGLIVTTVWEPINADWKIPLRPVLESQGPPSNETHQDRNIRTDRTTSPSQDVGST